MAVTPLVALPPHISAMFCALTFTDQAGSSLPSHMIGRCRSLLLNLYLLLNMIAIEVHKLFLGECTEITIFSTPFGETERLVLNSSLHCPDKATCFFFEGGDWEIVENDRNYLPAWLFIVVPYLNGEESSCARIGEQQALG